MKTNELELKQAKDLYGRDFTFLKTGFVKGRNWLTSNGWNVCPNKLYYSKEGQYIHYNSLMGCWLQDDYQKTEMGEI